MENVQDNEIDLRLGLSITKQCQHGGGETISMRDAGANANSRSRTDTNPGHSPLPELVWSTQNGLSIKCGGCSSCFAGMSNDVVAFPSQNNEKCMVLVKSALAPLSVAHTVESVGEVKCVDFIEMETHNNSKGKECMSIPVANVTGTSESAKCGPPFLEKVEETAENDVIVKETENVVEESSGESFVSCSGASKKNMKRGFEHELISTSKRLKKQSQECGMVKKQDSSFMNWISNMVKPYPQEDGHHLVDDKTIDNVAGKIFGFRSVFKSLYSQRIEETKTQRDNSKDIIFFDSQKSQKPLSNLLATNYNSIPEPTAPASSGCKKPVEVTSTYDKDALKCSTSMTVRSCCFCGKSGHESRDCLQINENKHVFVKKKVKVSGINQIASTSESNKLLNQDKILGLPKEMFDTIRRLRLSRTDILKWMKSRSAVATLDGYFLRLRLAKWEEGVGGAGYYVACITDENTSKGFKQPIRVNIGGVQCLVDCRYISNCDFLEDELVAWCRATLKTGRTLLEENLSTKLEEKKKLGLSIT